MNRIIRWYNTNRKKVWVSILIIAFIILIIKVLDSISYNQHNALNKVENNNTSNILFNSISMTTDESTVSGQKLSSYQTDMLTTLNEFASYCSDGKIENAYELLSEDCKKQMYPTKDIFKSAYYDQIFNGKKKNITAENWINNIYKIKYMEDALSTGIYDEKNIIQDYITLVKDEEGNVKLNVNGYIGKEKIDLEQQNDNLQIKIIETNIYMDYQTYAFEITNKSDKTILLNDPHIEDTMYIKDENDAKYQAYTHEISQAELKIAPLEKKVLTIKYYNKYSSSRAIKDITFAKIILDYDAFSNYQNIGYYNNYGEIQITL